jgi:hypothetical protein
MVKLREIIFNWVTKIMRYILKKTFFAILLVSCCFFALICCNEDNTTEYKTPLQSSAETETNSSETTQIFDTQKSENGRDYSKNY